MPGIESLDISHPSCTTIFGSTGSGKSTLIKYKVYKSLKKGLFDFIFVFTAPSTVKDGDYDWISDSKFLVMKNHLGNLKKIMEAQEKEEKPRPGLIIFDDITGQINWLSGGLTDKLLTTNRHLNLSIVISIHYVYKITPIMRECTKDAMIFHQQTMRSIKALQECFGQEQFGGKYEEFKKYLMENTSVEKHQFLYWKKAKPALVPLIVPYPVPDFDVICAKSADYVTSIDMNQQQSQQQQTPGKTPDVQLPKAAAITRPTWKGDLRKLDPYLNAPMDKAYFQSRTKSIIQQVAQQNQQPPQ